MSIKPIIFFLLLLSATKALGQSESAINQTDSKGRKQGHWIKGYPDESLQYDGYFVDNHPVGEFKRYYETKALKSVLIFSSNGKEATAILYHQNGNIASKGKYVNQKKEGKWQFFSELVKNGLLEEEFYSDDKKNGVSVKFYPDSTIAEKINYVNDLKQGEWTKYHQNGKLLLRSTYKSDKVEGKFETWFDNGKPEFSGTYKNDARDGLWIIYNEDGSVRYRVNYEDGITKDRQMDLDQSKIQEEREKNKGQIEDPAGNGNGKKP
jgi:antitoxin component YwqK of YwqJK toxin-antitoxin module